jgi:phosphopantothenoylcysteine decarboxylase/phosphopantothenate--cysteine ligase
VVAGPVSVPASGGVAITPVTTAEQMLRAMQGAAPHADVVLMAAAVADYRPARVSKDKLKRSGDKLTLTLEPNADILATVGAAKPPGQLVVGFALETSNGVANARGKLVAKKADLIVLNSPQDGIGGDTNKVTLVEALGARALPAASKREVAEAILDRVCELREAPSKAGRRRKAPAKPARGKRATKKARTR